MDHILQLLASLENFNWMPNTFSILNFKLVLACSWLTYWSSWLFCVSVYSKFSFVLLLRHDLSWISSKCKCSTRLIIFWLVGFWKSSRLIWTWKHFRLKLAAHLSRELFSHIVKRALVQIFGNYCLKSFLFSSTLPTNFSHFYLPYISVLSPEIPTTRTVSDSPNSMNLTGVVLDAAFFFVQIIALKYLVKISNFFMGKGKCLSLTVS